MVLPEVEVRNAGAKTMLLWNLLCIDSNGLEIQVPLAATLTTWKKDKSAGESEKGESSRSTVGLE